ncbi:hypothetical protein PAGA_b0269 [Pseudoalteromonas agarivorans DSM 14585]|uniref:Uncharacterized protein n=1 Tax=Pseudoalteromonas agarivorans DSM 14585 TaxID=1312369 RepID=A0ACA8E1Q6_9GAMM|nr:hypothetical protein PAGA_b0269 [Pseudoalteromonas agarivorans DSM 14585]
MSGFNGFLQRWSVRFVILFIKKAHLKVRYTFIVLRQS